MYIIIRLDCPDSMANFKLHCPFIAYHTIELLAVWKGLHLCILFDFIVLLKIIYNWKRRFNFSVSYLPTKDNDEWQTTWNLNRLQSSCFDLMLFTFAVNMKLCLFSVNASRDETMNWHRAVKLLYKELEHIIERMVSSD